MSLNLELGRDAQMDPMSQYEQLQPITTQCYDEHINKHGKEEALSSILSLTSYY